MSVQPDYRTTLITTARPPPLTFPNRRSSYTPSGGSFPSRTPDTYAVVNTQFAQSEWRLGKLVDERIRGDYSVSARFPDDDLYSTENVTVDGDREAIDSVVPCEENEVPIADFTTSPIGPGGR